MNTIDQLKQDVSNVNKMLEGKPFSYFVTVEGAIGPHKDDNDVRFTLYMRERNKLKDYFIHHGDINTTLAILSVLVLHLKYKKEIMNASIVAGKSYQPSAN